MRHLIKKDRSLLLAAAMGRIPCSLCIENAMLLNTLTGECYRADVDVLGEVIVRVRTGGEAAEQPAKQTLDAQGMYLLPGFLDAHMHIESTLLVPENFGKAAVTWGTTTVFTDPHEIANVLGVPGVQYMLESAKRSPLRHFLLVPSCVPSFPGFETSGAVFTEKEIEALLAQENVIGIAELMDYIGILNDEPRMKEIIRVGEHCGAFLQGHAPELCGKELCAYLDGGPVSDHESENAAELLEKRRLGMYVDARVHSVEEARELRNGIEPGLFRDYVSLCTDDSNAYRLATGGHINSAVADLIEAGMDPIEAVRLGTLNAAHEYSLQDVGAIAPGYAADFQLVHSLDFRRKPAAVFIGGKQVAQDGVFLGQCAAQAFYNMGNTVCLGGISGADDFRLPAHGRQTLDVMVVNEGYAEGTVIRRELPVRQGFAELPDLQKGALNYLCVLNRHGKPNKTIALYSGFGLQHGAVASSIGHDSHNLLLIYADAEDAFVAVKALESCGGGFCYVCGGKVRALLKLPVAGLMSDLPLAETARECALLEDAVTQARGKPFTLYDMIFETLPAFPRYTPTDLGVVDGIRKCFMEITK